MAQPVVTNEICPHPEYETVTCPRCRESIRGVVPEGTSGDPAARCPACEELIESVILPE